MFNVNMLANSSRFWDGTPFTSVLRTKQIIVVTLRF